LKRNARNNTKRGHSWCGERPDSRRSSIWNGGSGMANAVNKYRGSGTRKGGGKKSKQVVEMQKVTNFLATGKDLGRITEVKKV